MSDNYIYGTAKAASGPVWVPPCVEILTSTSSFITKFDTMYALLGGTAMATLMTNLYGAQPVGFTVFFLMCGCLAFSSVIIWTMKPHKDVMYHHLIIQGSKGLLNYFKWLNTTLGAILVAIVVQGLFTGGDSQTPITSQVIYMLMLGFGSIFTSTLLDWLAELIQYPQTHELVAKGYVVLMDYHRTRGKKL